MTERRPFQGHVKITAELPADGKVTGRLTYRFTRGDHVSVTCDAHVNDDLPAVAYRGQDYLLHIHAYLWADGEWHDRAEGETFATPYVKRRADGKDAPPSYAEAIVRAIVDSVAAVATPAVLARAAYNAAYDDESHALAELEQAREALKVAQTAARAATKRRHAAEGAAVRAAELASPAGE